MSHYVSIRGKLIQLPKGLKLTETSPAVVAEVISYVSKNMWCDAGGMPSMGVLSFDPIRKIFTKRTHGLLYWIIVERNESVAAGVFVCGKNCYIAEMAAAIPRVRGQGLYYKVLKYLRSTYKSPLMSDKKVSVATLLSWIKAGATADDRAGRMRINPKRHFHISCFLALEAVRKS